MRPRRWASAAARCTGGFSASDCDERRPISCRACSAGSFRPCERQEHAVRSPRRSLDNWLTHDRRVVMMALGAGLPGILVSLVLLWSGDFSSRLCWTLTLLVLALWWGVAFALRDRVIFPLQTISNLLAALREEDFSIRARGSRRHDPLGEVLIEVNALADTLRAQRMGALDASGLLGAVMEEIPVAVFAFDPDRRLRLVNRAGERLLARPSERLIGLDANALGLATALEHEHSPTIAATFPGGFGRWEVRNKVFRQGGLPLELLVLTDVSRSLRDEERQAWQRLIRVIGHEINNSLAPIKSIAHSLERLLTRNPRAYPHRHCSRYRSARSCPALPISNAA